MMDKNDENDPGSAQRAAGGWLLRAAVLVALVHALSLWTTGPVDDDYIVYRYARNWLAGEGLVFNPGGALVEGVTSPLWLLIVTVGVWLGVAPEIWSPAIGVLAAGVLTWFVGRAAERIAAGRSVAAVAPWLIALSPAVAWHAIAGLGTLPMAAVIAIGVERWCVWSRTGDSRALAMGAIAFAVACSFRLEAGIVWLAWLVLARPAGRLRPLEIGWALLPVFAVASITAARWQVFGTLLPHAFHVKSLPFAVELEYGARYLMQSSLEGGLALLLLAGAFVPRGSRPTRAIGVAAIGALVFVLVVGGDWIVFGRFLVPFSSLAALSVVGVLAGVASVPVVRLGALAAIAVTLFGLVSRPQAVFESRFFEDWWLTVGDAFRSRAPEGARVAISPIGAFGWRSDVIVIDMLGLTHASLLDREPDLEFVGVKGHHRHDGKWVMDQGPEYLLLGNAVLQPDTGALEVNPWERGIYLDPRFARYYSACELELERGDGSRQTLPYYARQGVAPLR